MLAGDTVRSRGDSTNHVDSRLVNIAIGVIMVLGGISQFFPASMSSIVVGIYVIAFGVGK